MILGIDASNIRAGGGLRHLIELLTHANVDESTFDTVIVWASKNTLEQLPDKNWLVKKTHLLLNKSLIYRIIWQKIHLSKEAAKDCTLLFLPSGDTSSFHPYVSMCQNLLPFEPVEKKRYGISFTRLRLELLKLNQCKSFTKSDGTIFLSDYSLEQVKKTCGLMKDVRIIPHGVSSDFRIVEEKQKANSTIKLLYVSIIDMYKHQWNVVKAVYELLDDNYDVELTLIGSSYKPVLKKLNKAINEKPEYKRKISVVGNVSHHELKNYYKEADVFVFASSCETFGMIVLEAMAIGLPIACSNKSSMKEVIGEAGIYFNPLNSSDIAKSIGEYIKNPKLREKMRKASHARSSNYTWERSSKETLNYLSNFCIK